MGDRNGGLARLSGSVAHIWINFIDFACAVVAKNRKARPAIRSRFISITNPPKYQLLIWIMNDQLKTNISPIVCLVEVL